METAWLQSATSAETSGETAEPNERRWFILVNDWTWWAWAATALLLAAGWYGFRAGFVAAMGLTAGQAVMMLVREKSLAAFPVQLRVAYLAFQALSFAPLMQWLSWALAIATFALVLFGYCTMARLLSLLPWNRRETFSFELLVRTFTSRPSFGRLTGKGKRAGCAGGLCSIEAQIRTKTPHENLVPTKLPTPTKH